MFWRANDIAGTSWPVSPVIAATSLTDVKDVSMTIVNDLPFISGQYKDGGTKRVFSLMASDATGSTWDSVVNVSIIAGSSNSIRACYTSDRPAIAFTTENVADELIFVRAQNNTATAWDSVVPVAGPSGFEAELGAGIGFALIDGGPVLTCSFDIQPHNIDAPFSVKANDAAGSSWGTATPIVPSDYSERVNLYQPHHVK